MPSVAFITKNKMNIAAFFLFNDQCQQKNANTNMYAQQGKSYLQE